MKLPAKQVRRILRHKEPEELCELLWEQGFRLMGGNLSRAQWEELARAACEEAPHRRAVLESLLETDSLQAAQRLLTQVRRARRERELKARTRRRRKKQPRRSKAHRGRAPRPGTGTRTQITKGIVRAQVQASGPGEFDACDEELWYPDHGHLPIDLLWHDLRSSVRDGFRHPTSTGVFAANGEDAPTRLGLTSGEALEEKLAAHQAAMEVYAYEGLARAPVREEVEVLQDLVSERLAGHQDLLAPLVLLSRFWVRSLASWTCEQSEPIVVLRSLLDHLFVRYPVPESLYLAWESREGFESRWLYWFVCLGAGGSLVRFVERVREHQEDAHGEARWGKITRRMVAHLLEAPPTLSAAEAAAWAETRRLGGGDRHFVLLMGHPATCLDPTGLPLDDVDRRFWDETVRWLVRHGDALQEPEWARILQWTEEVRAEAPLGEIGFRWRGRTLAGVRRAVAAAERRRRDRERLMKNPPGRWAGRGWDWKVSLPTGEWSLTEITDQMELALEGEAQQHCVGGYHASCAVGRVAVFSLRLNGLRRLTVAVESRARGICEAKGFRNRYPTDTERAVLDAWSDLFLRPGGGG